MTRILLTRHGQTLWNVEGRVQGNLDSPLTEKGLLQARSLAVRLRDEGIEQIYSSDSPRAIYTAEVIQREIGLNKTILANNALREINFGEWEGHIWKDLRETYPDAFKVWETEPHLFTVPGGENMNLVTQRAWNFVQKVVKHHSEETICLVTHGVTLKMLITKALGYEVHEWTKTPWQYNTALNIFELVGQLWIPRVLGDITHLEEFELK